MGRFFLFVFLILLPFVGHSQDRTQTLADIRQELSYLYVEIKKLQRELSTSKAPTGIGSGQSALVRLADIEAELQALIDQTEILEYKVEKIVEDGTKRIRDLEFRLVELEGGDITELNETTTLGGDDSTVLDQTDLEEELELSIGEEADFALAKNALAEKRYDDAAELFSRFVKTYPDSPLIARAHFLTGKAFDAKKNYQKSARAYLESFSKFRKSDIAPEALISLGRALIKFGKTEAGCQALSKVEVMFPEDPIVEQAEKEMQNLNCL